MKVLGSDKKETLTFRQYEKFAGSTAIYPNRGDNLIYPVLGLCGEAGEVAEKVKKIIRDKGGELTDQDRMDLLKEAGDIQWYVSQLAFELGGSLEEVAVRNVDKLSSRQERGVIGGSGDDR